VPVAGAALVGLVALLVLLNHRSAGTLRENLLVQQAQQNQLHAAALGHLLGSSLKSIRTVAASSEVAAYFEGRDLGMSMEYGLGLALLPIRERLRELTIRTELHQSPDFSRAVLLDAGGQLLSDSGSWQGGKTPWREPLDPSLRDGAVVLAGGGRDLAVVLAHRSKGRHVGYLVGWIRPESVASALVGADRADPGRIGFVLLRGELAYRPDPPLDAAVPAPATVASLPPEGRAGQALDDGLVGVRTPVPGMPFSLVMVRPATDFLGVESTGAAALALALAAAATLAVVGLALSSRTTSLVLQARLEESVRRGREVAEKHAALEREAAERRRLEADNARLALATEQVAEAIVISDTNGVLQFVNPALARALGQPAEALVGQSVLALDAGRNVDAAREAAAALRAGRPWRGELLVERADGAELELDVVISPVRDEAGATVNYVAVARDTTEERRLREQLRHAQKLEAIGTLAGGVAHDFNNLLTAVKGYAGAALEELRAWDPARADVEEIKRAADRGADLVRQLLAFSRKQVLKPQVLDLDTAVAGVDKLLRRLAGEQLSLEVVRGPGSWRVRVDPGQLEQVLVNLVVNARDATPPGGRVTVSTDNVELDEAGAHRWAEGAPGRWVRLSVSDTGSGMDAATMAHVFEPFFTTKERGRGTGLGLSTVYGIVRQSRGFIGVISAPGAGTRFDVFLPAEQAEAQAPDRAAPAPRRAHAARPGETILVAEDEVQVRSLLRTRLTAEGYTVLAASDGRDALDLLERHAGRIDLLLSDLVMPNLGGRELARRFHQRHPASPVVLMSGYAEEAVAAEGDLGGEAAFVQKPFEMADLAALVRKLLDERPAA